MGHQFTIAAFDFDGTITRKDTLLGFIIHSRGYLRLLAGAFVLSPIMILYLLRKISNHTAKEKLFSFFYRGMKESDFQEHCDDYSLNEVDHILNAKVMDRVKWHQTQGHEVIIISASVENWIRPWAINNGIGDVIGTCVEITNMTVTGRFSSKNCSGLEKVRRLIEKYPDRKSYYMYAYGNSMGDGEMLGFADEKMIIE
jgi:phosphatidylglycerophosphatase C